MKIVAIDPSFRNMALIGASVHSGTSISSIDFVHLERTEKASKGLARDDDWKCARVLANAVHRLTQRADLVFLEQPVGSQSARSSWTLGITLGVLAAIQTDVVRLTPLMVKETFTGNKHASKAEMIDRAVKLFPKVEFPLSRQRGKLRINAAKAEHIADALGVLYTGLRTKEYEEFTKGWH